MEIFFHFFNMDSIICGKEPQLIDNDIITLHNLWFRLIDIALVVTLYQCYKKKFLNDILYWEHCRFWFGVFKRCLFADLIYRILSGLYRKVELDGSLADFGVPDIRLYSYMAIFIGLVLVVSLVPATLQNWFGSKRDKIDLGT